MARKLKSTGAAMRGVREATPTSSALARAMASLSQTAQPPLLADTLRATQAGAPSSLPAPKPQKILSATDLGPLVRAARRNMGLSQQAFADLAGVGRRFVSELESGKPTLEFDKVLKVCAAAGVDIAASMRSPS